MSELLSASSLLLTVVGVIFSLWYSEIAKALQTGVPEHAANRKKPLREVGSVLFTRSAPLALSSATLALVFLPDALGICAASISEYRALGLGALRNYSSIQTAFCLVELFSVSLAVYLTYLLVQMIKLRGRLASEKETSGSKGGKRSRHKKAEQIEDGEKGVREKGTDPLLGRGTTAGT